MRYYLPLLVCLVLSPALSNAQLLTREDSLNAGLSPNPRAVIISGYGEAKYSFDNNLKTATANLTRNVLFVGYRFNEKFTFFSEIELEDAKVDGSGGEVSVEQCVLKFDLNRNNYLLAGLFIPRIGIMNENHLPTTFNGNDRHMVEQMIIPATWREIGVCYYGSSTTVAGLNWSAGIMNGLNAAGITGTTGIRDARYEGRDASGSNIALTGSLLYSFAGLRIQGSAYYGGSVGLTPRSADSLQLNSGPFGTPVALTEANIQYRKSGWTFKGLLAYGSITDAAKLNRAYASNAAESFYGYFGEVGYNLLEKKNKVKQLNLFVRYEGLDLMATVPENGIKDETVKQQYIIAGITYLPFRGVAIKADWKHLSTGEPDARLLQVPGPTAPPYLSTNNFYQLGIAYSF